MYKIIGADGKEYGPISAEQLRQWVAEGRANAQTQVLPEGQMEWKTIAEVPELAPLVSPYPTAATPVSAPQYVPGGQPPKTNPLAIARARPRNSLAARSLLLLRHSLQHPRHCCFH